MQEEKEGYWTPLERSCRDWFFRQIIPITPLLGFIPHAANVLTISRFLITFWAMLDFLFYHNPIERQIWFLSIAGTTDLLDGPTARNNKDVTAFGTAADHAADFILILWMISLSFYITHGFNAISPLEILAIVMLKTTILLITIGMFLVATGMWLFRREKRMERPEQPYLKFLEEFLLKDLVTTINARIHNNLAVIGICSYMAGVIWKHNLYIFAGGAILLVQLVYLGIYLYEVLQTPYEDRIYRIRKALQRKIENLEEKLKRRKDKDL